MGKLDTEGKTAGGKVLVLLLRLQVQKQLSDPSTTDTYTATFIHAREQPGTHSNSNKSIHARPHRNVMNTHCVYELSLYYVILSYCYSVWSGSKFIRILSIGLC